MRARGSLACSANRPPQTPLFLSPALAESLVFPYFFNYSPFCLFSFLFFLFSGLVVYCRVFSNCISFLLSLLVRRRASCLSKLRQEQTRLFRLRPCLQTAIFDAFCDSTGSQSVSFAGCHSTGTPGRRLLPCGASWLRTCSLSTFRTVPTLRVVCAVVHGAKSIQLQRGH